MWEKFGFLFGGDADCYYAYSSDNAVSWSAPLELNPNAAGDSLAESNPHIISLGGGEWLAAYSSQDDLGGPNDDFSGLDIHVRKSTDNGASWSAPYFMSPDAQLSERSEVLEQLMISGSALVATMTRPSSSAGDTPFYVARSVDGGVSWSTSVQLSTLYGYPESNKNEYSRAAADGAGRIIAVLQSDNSLYGSIGNDTDIVFTRSTDDGATWTQFAALNAYATTDSTPDGTPSIATDNLGIWVAIWRTNGGVEGVGTDGDILVARSTDDGATWGAAAILNDTALEDSGREDLNPNIVTNRAGKMIAVWENSELPDYDIKFAISNDEGLTWGAAAPLQSDWVNDIGDDTFPDIVYSGSGNWVSAWRVQNNPSGGSDRDLMYSRSADDGNTWAPTALLNSRAAVDSGEDSHVRLASDSAGNVVAVWESNDQLGGSGFDYDIHFALSTDHGATWSNQAALNSGAASTPFADLLPAVVHSSGTNWISAWQSNDDLGSSIGSDDDILVAKSTDGGSSWGPPVALNSYAASDSLPDAAVQLAANGNGTCLAVWANTDNTSSAIQLSRSTDDGASWSPAITITTTPYLISASSPGPNPRVVWTGGTKWIAVVARIDTSGPMPPSGPEADIWYSESADDGLTWSAPAMLNSDGVGDTISDEDPVLCAGVDRVTCAWNFKCGASGGPYGSDIDILTSSAPLGGVSAIGDWSIYD